jgi:hypothetical protein
MQLLQQISVLLAPKAELSFVLFHEATLALGIGAKDSTESAIDAICSHQITSPKTKASKGV